MLALQMLWLTVRVVAAPAGLQGMNPNFTHTFASLPAVVPLLPEVQEPSSWASDPLYPSSALGYGSPISLFFPSYKYTNRNGPAGCWGFCCTSQPLVMWFHDCTSVSSFELSYPLKLQSKTRSPENRWQFEDLQGSYLLGNKNKTSIWVLSQSSFRNLSHLSHGFWIFGFSKGEGTIIFVALKMLWSWRQFGCIYCSSRSILCQGEEEETNRNKHSAVVPALF